jgi:hypothetical protein
MRCPRFAVTFLTMLASVSLLGACSSSDSGPAGSGMCGGGTPYDGGIPDAPQVDALDEATFQTEYVDAWCDAMEGCCQAEAVTFGRTACETKAAETVAGLQNGIAQYDAEAGATCISMLRWFELVCPKLGTLSSLAPGIACGGVYTGTLAAGAPCTNRSDCAPPAGGSALCLTVGYPGQKVCQVFLSDRGPGEKCTRLIDDAVEHHGCVDGYDCNEDTGVCEKECDGGLGASCADQGCVSGLRCDDTDHCVEVTPIGGQCTGALQCYGSCDNGVCTLGLDAEACYSP